MLIIEAENGIVGGQNGATAVAKYDVHALIAKHLHDHVCARHSGSGEWVIVWADGVWVRVHGFLMVNTMKIKCGK
jgi:hypothetical protein